MDQNLGPASWRQISDDERADFARIFNVEIQPGQRQVLADRLFTEDLFGDAGLKADSSCPANDVKFDRELRPAGSRRQIEHGGARAVFRRGQHQKLPVGRPLCRIAV